tara:strand:- start:470 stop:1813 length:1344 start_codon:yes stop_codon:yes gene_type:complete
VASALPSQFLINEFFISQYIETVEEHFSSMFPNVETDTAIYVDTIDTIHRAIPILGRSNAAYHDIEHTFYVFSCGLEIIRGKHIIEGNISLEDWCHFVIGLLLHDVGYIRNILESDNDKIQTIDMDGKTIKLTDEDTDAVLTNYHVFRGQAFAKQFLINYKTIDLDKINKLIAGTTFPIPEDFSPEEFAHLVQAADLIGQMGELYYTSKIAALYDEFKENKTTEKLNLNSPADLLSTYPSFFWHVVHPNVKDVFKYLEAHEAGKLWLTSLVNQVFAQENISILGGKSKRLFQELVRAKQFAVNHDERLALITEILMKYFNCQIGHVYSMNKTGDKIESSGIWRVTSEEFEDFKKVTQSLRFSKGMGMPGHAWETREVQWISDLGQRDPKEFPRATACKKLGIKFAFGIPILSGGTCRDVLEIFSQKSISPTKSDKMFIKMIANAIND